MMNFLQFREKFFNLSIFTINQVYAWYSDFDRNNFTRWVKRGLIIRLRNGVYTFPEYKTLPHYQYYFANIIYKPSYISLQTALAFYGLVPESVLQITSVTTLKTESFVNDIGEFSYKTIKKNLMFGYLPKEIGDDKRFMIAIPEKAIIDFLHLYPEYNTKENLLDLRFDEDLLNDMINKDLLIELAEKTKIKALIRRIKLLIKVYEL